MKIFDIIRHGKFIDPKCENLRKQIIEKDCGLTADCISGANTDLQNAKSELEILQILADCLHEMDSELIH